MYGTCNYCTKGKRAVSPIVSAMYIVMSLFLKFVNTKKIIFLFVIFDVISFSGGNIGNNQVLSHVRLQVITNDVCRRTFSSSIVIASTLCTSGAGGTSTCSGDSGGPLVASNRLVSS